MPIKEKYQRLIDSKLATNAAKIPKEWLLDPKYPKNINASSTTSVLSIPRSCGILTGKEITITEDYDATALLEKMANRELSSYEVVLAFCKRAAVAHQLVNCVTEIMFEEALARAKECDEYLSNEGKTLGPFHGLPISIKDSFNIKGYQTTMGFVSFLSHPPAPHDSGIVSIMLSAGAIPYVKTNVPQTLSSSDTSNHIFGTTLNPFNPSLTAGGSSGGEGALLALRGSPLGIGTDVAGSVRIPALCNGIYAFKPTPGRIPYLNEEWGGREGSPGLVPSSIGPMGRSVRDMELFMKTAVGEDGRWEVAPTAVNVPWRVLPPLQPETRKLRLGFIMEDEKWPLHPPMLRTMKAAVRSLESAGHYLLPMDSYLPPHTLHKVSYLSIRYFSLDPSDPSYTSTQLSESGEDLISSLKKRQDFHENADWTPSLDSLWDLNVERSKMLELFHGIIVKERLDGILIPGYQSCAPLHDTFGFPVYTVLANFLNYPAASIPFLTADKEADKQFVREVQYVPAYEPDRIQGAPCGIQVMGRPMRDEELCGLVEVVSEVLKAKEQA